MTRGRPLGVGMGSVAGRRTVYRVGSPVLVTNRVARAVWLGSALPRLAQWILIYKWGW
jgi:hypothetical protein